MNDSTPQKGGTSSFQHDAKIPTEIALAIWRVMHNRATGEDWELLDKTWYQQVLTYVESICLSNGMSEEVIKLELNWWSKELAIPNN